MESKGIGWARADALPDLHIRLGGDADAADLDVVLEREALDLVAPRCRHHGLWRRSTQHLDQIFSSGVSGNTLRSHLLIIGQLGQCQVQRRAEHVVGVVLEARACRSRHAHDAPRPVSAAAR